jgi:hypothetical protein
MKRTRSATSIHPPTAPPTLAPIIVALLLERLPVRSVAGGIAVAVSVARVSDGVDEVGDVSILVAALEDVDVELATTVDGPKVALPNTKTAVSVSQHRCFSASDSQQNCDSLP